jgi:hypothetical protein
VALEKSGHEKGRSAGLSKESAGEASNLMRRPVQRRNRNATTSACVGWDFDNIENRYSLRKPVRGSQLLTRGGLKRLDDHQNNDPDHQYRWYLIDNSIEFLISGVPVGGEILHTAGQKAVHTGQHKHQKKFGVKPGR